MKIEGESIAFRQSWLGNFTRCPERGRQAIVRPDWEPEGDAALAGTAAHSGEQHVLEGKIKPEEIESFTYSEAIRLVQEADRIGWNKFADVEELAFNAKRAARAWLDHLYPRLPKPDLGLVEWRFDFPVDHYRGYEIRIQGTADYVPYGYGDLRDEGPIWDWKHPGQLYRQHEKKKELQPRIYSWAAVLGGFRTWPVDFNFGVMPRGSKSQAQIVPVQSHEGHTKWALRAMHSALDYYLDVGLDSPWLRRDDHFLCSQTWCSWWSVCKGSDVPFEPDAGKAVVLS